MENSESNVVVTVRILMVGKEIGGIIGKGGNVIASVREKSGAKINIPNAQGTPERIVTITGHQSQIKEAFRLITEKLEKDMNASVSRAVSGKVPVTLKLVVPASQCGSIIGRGGSKIKEIRDTSACSIQVQSDMLPFSTERAVTLNGSPSSIVHCVDMLCDVMIQFPARSATVPYKPQSNNPAVLFHHGQAYMLQGNYAVPHPDITKLRHLAAMHSYTEDTPGGLLDNFTNLSAVSRGSGKVTGERGSSGCVNLPTKVVDGDTQEVTVSNEVIGCIIGKGGSRINEIRAMSGAQISIDKSPEKDSKKERTITITGTPEEISLAQYLINTSIQLFSHPNKPTKSSSDAEASTSSTPRPLMSLNVSPSYKPIPLSQLLGSTGVFASSGSFGGPGIAGPYPGAFRSGPSSFSDAMHSAREVLMNRSRHFGYSQPRRTRRQRRSTPDEEDQKNDVEEGDSPVAGDASPNGKEKRKTRREKFQPY